MNIDEELLSLLSEVSYYLKFKLNKSSGQKRILSLLKKEGEMTQRDLTFQLGIQSSSVSEILEKLESKGLIDRRQSRKDKRTLDVFLTDRGLKEADEADRERFSERQYFFEGFTDTEKDMLKQLLTRLLFNFKNNLSPENQDGFGRNGYHKGHKHFHKRGHKHGRHPKHKKH